MNIQQINYFFIIPSGQFTLMYVIFRLITLTLDKKGQISGVVHL